VTFEVAAEAYGRFMGRYSEPLSVVFADRVGITTGQRALDVGCGPGVLTAELVRRLGVDSVSAVDPSASFVAATRARCPGVDADIAPAEALPYPDGTFDVSLAQLVVHFMTDPVAGIAEMARVTRPGGRVATCVWDLAGGRGPLALFWIAAHDLDASVHGEEQRAGGREGQLAQLSESAGLSDVESFSLTVEVPIRTLEDWWQPYTLGVGPAGAHVAGLDANERAALRARCFELLPTAPFVQTAVAWGAAGRA